MKLIKKIPALAVTGILVGSLLTSPVEAKVTGHIVEDTDEKQYLFSLSDLSDSFRVYLRNPLYVDAQLFLKYSEIRDRGKIASYLDDENGYIDFNDISSKYIDSLRGNGDFELDRYTESTEAKKVEPKPLHTVVKKENGSIEILPPESQVTSFEVLSIE